MPVYQVQNGSWARKHDMPERVLPRDAGEHDAARVRQCGCVVLSITLTAGIVLQVVFVALLVGFGIQALGEHGEPLIVGIGHLQRLVFKILAMVMWVAPIGAFGAMAAVVGETGSDALPALAMILLAFYATCLPFVVGVLGTILRLVTGLSRKHCWPRPCSGRSKGPPTIRRRGSSGSPQAGSSIGTGVTRQGLTASRRPRRRCPRMRCTRPRPMRGMHTPATTLLLLLLR